MTTPQKAVIVHASPVATVANQIRLAWRASTTPTTHNLTGLTWSVYKGTVLTDANLVTDVTGKLWKATGAPLANEITVQQPWRAVTNGGGTVYTIVGSWLNQLVSVQTVPVQSCDLPVAIEVDDITTDITTGTTYVSWVHVPFRGTPLSDIVVVEAHNATTQSVIRSQTRDPAISSRELNLVPGKWTFCIVSINNLTRTASDYVRGDSVEYEVLPACVATEEDACDSEPPIVAECTPEALGMVTLVGTAVVVAVAAASVVDKIRNKKRSKRAASLITVANTEAEKPHCTNKRCKKHHPRV